MLTHGTTYHDAHDEVQDTNRVRAYQLGLRVITRNSMHKSSYEHLRTISYIFMYNLQKWTY
jgi:hypothetical protein